jgi:hypothetical protein
MPSWHRTGQARILCRHRLASDSSDDLGLSDTADREPGRHCAADAEHQVDEAIMGATSLQLEVAAPHMVKSLAPRAAPDHTH